jgi:YjbE family integral membrane protein
MLVWIGAKLLIEENDTHNIKSSDTLLGAIKVIIIADFIMSLDNILGVAAAAKGNLILIIIGLLLSIPIVILGSKIIIDLIKKFHFIIYIGAAVIGYTAGEILISDPILATIILEINWLPHFLPIAFIPLVLYIGHILNFSKE